MEKESAWVRESQEKKWSEDTRSLFLLYCRPSKETDTGRYNDPFIKVSRSS